MQVGGFTLEAVLGTGGMGQVWQATHGSGQVAAVKVLLPDAPDDLDAEVRAVAALSHPGIVAVYDTGKITLAEAHASAGQLRAGTRWIAMELLGGGTLLQRLPQMGPRSVRRVLGELLDALAHAHAHRLLHRDLKPANLLFDHRDRLRVTDFGLAHSTTSEPGALQTTTASGTPTWMAPEQFTAEWRRFGPWTDLYAVGGMAWAMACHRRPFPKGSTQAMFEARYGPPPPFAPQIAVPRGYEAWCRRLLHPEPTERFPDAASASYALQQLAFDEVDGPNGTTDAIRHLGAMTTVLQPVALPPPRPVPARPTPSAAPPQPATWQRGRLDDDAHPFPAAGLGLFSLRRPTLVGRQSERDALWQQHLAVAEGRGPATVWIEGEPGLGARALARWLRTRVEETGAARSLWVHHAAVVSAATGWGPAIRAALVANGLEGSALRRVVVDRCRLLEVPDTLAERVADWLDPDQSLSHDRRQRLLCDLLQAVAEARPLVLVCEGAPYAADTLEIVRRLPRGTPLLTVLTGPPGSAPEGSTRLRLGPLGDDDVARVMRQLLPLAPGTERELVEAAGGVPLRGVELLQDLVERDALEPSEAGYVRTGDGPLLAPQALWLARLDRVVPDPHDLVALEQAAVLGEVVGVDEWQQLMERPVRGLIDALLWHGLLTEDAARQRVAFAHGGLRDVLLQRMDRQGRLVEGHRKVAAYLAGLPRSTEGLLRQAHHWMLADDEPAALAARVIAYQNTDNALPYPDCLAGLVDVMARMEAIGIPPSDPAWAPARHIHMRYLLEQGDERAPGLLDALASDGERHGWPPLVHRCMTDRADLAQDQARLADAEAIALHALQVMDPAGLPAAAALCSLATTRQLQGRYHEASALFAHARPLYTAFFQELMTLHRAGCLARLGRLEEAQAEVERVRAFLAEQASGFAWVRGVLHQIEAVQCEATGDWAGSAQRLADAVVAIRGLEQRYAADVVEANLLVARFLAGDTVEPATVSSLIAALPTIQGHATRSLLAVLSAAVEPGRSAGHPGLWPVIERGLGPGGVADPRAAALLLRLGDLWLEQGFEEEARRAWSLARDQLRRLERADPSPAEQRLARREDDEPTQRIPR